MLVVNTGCYMEYIKFEKEENLPNLDTALYSDREPYVNEEIEIGISIEKETMRGCNNE